MKTTTTFTIIALFFFLANTTAQISRGFKYQAVARDADNNVYAEQLIGVQFAIVNQVTLQEAYREQHDVMTSENGVFAVNIGEGLPLTNQSFDQLDWSSNSYFVRIATSMDGQNYNVIGESRLSSVPYAKYAETAGNIDDPDPDPKNELQDIVVKGVHPVKGLELGLTGSDSTVFLPIGPDRDDDPVNEIQDLTFTNVGAYLHIGIQRGAATNRVDPNVENELQELSLKEDPANPENSVVWLTNSRKEFFPFPHWIDAGVIIKDTDPKNELQDLEQLASDVPGIAHLGLTKSDAFTIQYDVSSLNELQRIDLFEADNDDNRILRLSSPVPHLFPPTEVLLTDVDPTNELQKLGYESGLLTLSGADSDIDVREMAKNAGLDTDPGNEIQKLSKAGNMINLSEGGGSVELKDDDPTNELQDLSIEDGYLFLSGSENYVELPSSPWQSDQSGNISTNKSVTLNGFVTSNHWLEANKVNAQNITTSSIAMDGGNTQFKPRSLHFNNGGYYDVVANGRQVFIAGGAFANGQYLPAMLLKTDQYEAGMTVGQGGKIEARAQRMYAENFIQTSDARMKTDIEDVENVLGKVMDLAPKSYRFITDEENDRQIGFLAQEVARIFPDIVHYNADEDKYALSYTDFSVIAIAAIQEQQRQIEELKAMIGKVIEK